MEHCSFFQIIQFLTTVEQTKSAKKSKKRLVLVATPRVSRDAPGIVATSVVEVQKPVAACIRCWVWDGEDGEDGLVLARSKDLRNG